MDGDSAGGDLSGAFPSPQLAANSVGPSEIATDAVGETEIASQVIDTTHIKPDTLNSGDLAGNSVSEAELTGAAITMAKLNSGNGVSGASPEDHGSIAGDSCVYFSRTTPSAQAGELAIPRVSPTAHTETTLAPGLYFMPTVVTTDGIIPFTLCNYTGSPIDSPAYLLGWRLIAVG